MSVCRNLRGDGLFGRCGSVSSECRRRDLLGASHRLGPAAPRGRGSLMALFDRKTKGARSASGAVHVPPTASRHDGNTADRDGGRRRVANAAPASRVAPATAPAGRVFSAPAYETGSYSAVDARDAEAQVYAKRRREQARRNTLRVVTVAAVAVAVLLVALVVSGLLG